jgi:hypothetical protein
MANLVGEVPNLPGKAQLPPFYQCTPALMAFSSTSIPRRSKAFLTMACVFWRIRLAEVWYTTVCSGDMPDTTGRP